MGNWMTSQKINKRTAWAGECAYNFYGFYMKNYWLESVFSRCKETLTLKLIMTYSNLANLYFCKQNWNIYLFSVSDPFKDWKLLGFQ